MQSHIQNLKDSELTQVLADGFAMLYHNKPEFPVTYLAKYMKNHILCQQEIKDIGDKISHNSAINKEMQAKQKAKKEEQEKQQKRQMSIEEEQKKFFEKIQKIEYHEDVLDYFCDWIEKKHSLTGVYLGELISQKKSVDLEQEDSEEAHLDLEAPKIIKFKNTSRSHKQIMKNKTLSLESVSGRLVTGAAAGGEGEAEPGEGQEGEKEEKPKDQVYISSVVGNQDLNFFKYPKLGSFFAMSFKIKSYLSESVLDPNITKTQAFQKALEQYERQHEERETKFKQMYDEKAAEGVEEHQLDEMQKNYEAENAQFPKPILEDFDSIQRTFVLGVDTLGQDQGISDANQKKIKEYVNFLKQQWEKVELDGLKADIQRHLKLEQKIEGNPQQIFTKLIEEEDRELPGSEEVQKVKQNQKLVQLEVDTLRIERIKEYIADEKYEPFLEQIIQSKVLKNKQIIKYWLIFCGRSKQDITVEGTNLLDFRKSKKYLNKQSFSEKLTTYAVRGAKPDVEVRQYAKWQRIIKNMSTIEAPSVAASNIYLAFIIRYIQLVGKIRIADRERRVQVMKDERKARKDRKKQNDNKLKEKEEKLKVAKAEAEEKEEEFDNEAWENTYNEAQQNQLLEVGPEIHDEIDKDIENGQEIFVEEEEPVAEEPAEQKVQ